MTEFGRQIQRGMWITLSRTSPAARPSAQLLCLPRGMTCGNGTSPSDQIQSMWTESMWSKWNPNWSLYVSKPLFSG